MVFLLSKSLERVEWKRKQPTQSDLVSYAQPQNCLGRWRLLEIQEKTILPTEIFSIASTFQPFGSDDFPMFRVFFCHISSRDVSHVQAFVIFITICGNAPIAEMIQLEHFPQGYPFFPKGHPQPPPHHGRWTGGPRVESCGSCRRSRVPSTWKFDEKIPKKRWFDKKNVTP